MKAQRSRSRNNNDNHQPQRPNHPGMRGPTPCASHPRTLHGLLSLPFIASIPHSAIPSPTHLGSQALQSVHHPVPWEDSAQPGPSQTQGRTSLGLETRAPGFPREAVCPPLAWSAFPGPVSAWPVCGPGACLCQYKSEFRSWLGHRLTHHWALSEFCFDLLWLHCLTCPTLSKAPPHPSLKINSRPRSFFSFFLKKCLDFH